MSQVETPRSTYRRAIDGEGSYFKLSDSPVAYSVELGDLVVADYDATGAVRGIDLVGKQEHALERYLEMARKASRGPLTKKRGAIPGQA